MSRTVASVIILLVARTVPQSLAQPAWPGKSRRIDEEMKVWKTVIVKAGVKIE